VVGVPSEENEGADGEIFYLFVISGELMFNQFFFLFLSLPKTNSDE
jgi:hypothetical protein